MIDKIIFVSEANYKTNMNDNNTKSKNFHVGEVDL